MTIEYSCSIDHINMRTDKKRPWQEGKRIEGAREWLKTQRTIPITHVAIIGIVWPLAVRERHRILEKYPRVAPIVFHGSRRTNWKLGVKPSMHRIMFARDSVLENVDQFDARVLWNSPQRSGTHGSAAAILFGMLLGSYGRCRTHRECFPGAIGVFAGV